MFDFIVTNLPIVLCVLAGLGLLILEMFLPGFGIPGISGIVLMIISAIMVWVEAGALAALGMVVVCIALVAIALSIALKSAANGRLSKSELVLRESVKGAKDENESSDLSVFLGREGVTHTVLRPSGIAEFSGVRLNVVSEGAFIPKDAAVRIEQVEGNRIVVRKL